MGFTRGVVAYILNNDTVVSDYEKNSYSYAYCRTYISGKDTDSSTFTPSAIGKI